jgi:hypothetical protein
MKDNEVITGRLEEWEATSIIDNNEYLIWGLVYDDIHGRFKEGGLIHTSGIKESDHLRSGLKKGEVVRTRNSLYLLGEPR